ncbi:MAG: ATP phosphoribosyltransferase regulatory subunit [Candidatus Pacebacteria bacterium]|nr:ATP phosphoribosyltransferase regulatory subunit [Candidatus Paceibacterota bacterium]
MTDKKLSTEPYKGVRDFYPEDMAVQNYIFSIWKKVAQEFKYQEYSASILEPAELYKAKGEMSEEIVNEQMYTFTDKGDREVALRPEMTPTLARMVAAKRRSWKFPLRWFSIPNCFRYEKPQRGRKREHWQLNCDLMGIAEIEAEVEIISLAHKIMKEFGAKDEDFEIQINSRKLLESAYGKEMFGLLDKKEKMEKAEFESEWQKLSDKPYVETKLEDSPELIKIIKALADMGIKAKFTPSITRGFDYYTGMVFEVFDTNPENRRALFGGGRYDNLLEMFGVEPVPTVGFGMGDVTMRDFLETHRLPLKK